MNRTLAFAVLVLVACGRSETASRPEGPSEGVDSAAAVRALRVDTLRDSTGEHFSPSSTTVALTRTGGVVALDNDDKRIVIFDSGGVQRHSAGRPGSGPGEFRYLRGVFVLPGDSIAVWDPGLRRMSFFDAALKFDRTEPFPSWEFSSVFSEIVGRFADGRWVAKMATGQMYVDAKSGALAVVHTFSLVAGRSAEVPRLFRQLPSRAGVDVITGGKASSSVHLLRFRELDLGVGAICDSGAVLVDSGGVRVEYVTARAPSAWPLPRVGAAIRTTSERDDMVKSEMSAVDSLPSAGKARALLTQLVKRYRSRARPPAIDATGELWYDLDAMRFTPKGFFERVDSTARRSAFVRLNGFLSLSHFGRNAIATRDYGSDTTGMTVNFSHFAPGWTSKTPNTLGHCFASFTY